MCSHRAGGQGVCGVWRSVLGKSGGPKEPNFSPVQLAFRSWLIAAQTATKESWPGLGRRVLREVTVAHRDAERAEKVGAPKAAQLRAHADELTVATSTGSWSPDQGKQFRAWWDRGSLGNASPVLRDVVVQVVTGLVPVAPHDVGEWTDFGEVVRSQGQEKVRVRAAATKTAQQRGVLVSGTRSQGC